jgi:hypothetical protein
MLLTHFGRVTEIARLAADMKELVQALAQLGEHAKNKGAARHQLLIDEQRQLLLPRLRAHGVTLSDADIETLLAMDYELNAQGVGVWLDREAKT